MVLVLFVSCVKENVNLCDSSQVYLKASIGPVLTSTYTKGTGEIKSGYDGDLTIGVAKTYGPSVNFSNPVGCYVAEMRAPSAQNMGLRDISFEEFQGFPDATTPVCYVGWYPYEGTLGTDQGKTTVSIPVPKDAYTDILYSNIATGTRLSGFNTMVFSHALVKYSIKAYAMETQNGEASVESVWGVPVKVELERMPMTCVLGLPSSANEAVTVKSDGTQLLSRDVNSSGLQTGLSNAKELTYFLAPAPADGILRIKVTTKKGGTDIVKSQTLSIARDFQYGKHYQIYLRFTTHGTINAEVTVEDWQQGEFMSVESNTGLFYDLSETHTANSYIVSAANRYCFNATVRGNGYTGAAGIPGAPTDIYRVGEPVLAEIVWTDLVSSASENLDDYFSLVSKIEEGRVFFHVKSYKSNGRDVIKEGNVVVGVRDKDGKMLWTWHLWLTDRPAEQGYKNGFAVQDRDLGATSYDAVNEPAGINGLYYQWGRPTPLPLGKTVFAPDYKADGSWEQLVPVEFDYDETSAPVIVNRVKEPKTYFKAKATSSEGTLTKSLWGWRKETDEYAKTIYDPCPPGYRVPSIKLWRDLAIHDTKIVKGADNNNISVAFTVDVNSANVYYPMTGYYTSLNDPQVDKNVGAYMWAATYDIGTKEDDATDDRPYALDFAFENGVIKQMETRPEYSNYAMPVRCISRMSKAVVTDLSGYQTANSYMVPKNGYFKFKATVRGNGIGQLVSPGTTSTIDLKEQLQSVNIENQLVKVEPLWWHSYASPAPTLEELNQGKHFSLLNEGRPDADGYVSFNVSKWYEGNLILAGRDAKGEIVWSWHIWFTDEPEMMKSNSFVVMDRNLGATYAPVSPNEPTGAQLSETYGFYYQWGRKDPFLEKSTSVYKFDSSSGTYSSSSSAFATEATVANKTVANSVQNPMTYHLASEWRKTLYNPNDVDLIYQYYTTLYTYILDQDNTSQNQCFSSMVHPENRQSLWGYSAAKGYGVTTTKTMYDPCPPGYIVAHYLVWTNTDRDGSRNLYYTNLDAGFNAHGLTSFDGGIFLNYGLGADDVRHTLFDSSWFPFTGYLSPIATNKVNTNIGFFHSSTPAGNGSRSICYNFDKSGQGITNNIIGMPSSVAYPVRCQKE